MSEQWWQSCVQEKSNNLFLGCFVAGRPGRKQEVSVVVMGMGGEQKELESTGEEMGVVGFSSH